MDRFGNVHTSNSKPIIVISHGAWHVPAHYEPMAKPLREAGFQVYIPQHQSIGIEKDPGNALQNDAAAIAAVIDKNAQLRKDIILLMHSYGGIAGCEAVGMLNDRKSDQPRNPGASRIKRLVFLAAHVIDKDTAFFGYRKIPNIDTNEHGMTMHEHPYDRYYHEVSREDAEPALNLLQRMATSAFETTTKYEGWKDHGYPVTYIKCSQDTAVPPDLCDTYIAKMKAAGVEVDVETIDAGHCAHFTAPSAVVGVIEKMVEKMSSSE